MGMSVEEYEKWKDHPRVVVSIDDDYVRSLVVDGVVVWIDGNHEPEDMSLTRDLSVFVDAIRDAYDSSKQNTLEEAARICESMVVGGRAWTHDQSVAAGALFAAAEAIRALGVGVNTAATSTKNVDVNPYPDFQRASGDSICERCSQPYRKHPNTEHRDSNDSPWLRELCDGSLVKL